MTNSPPRLFKAGRETNHPNTVNQKRSPGIAAEALPAEPSAYTWQTSGLQLQTPEVALVDVNHRIAHVAEDHVSGDCLVGDLVCVAIAWNEDNQLSVFHNGGNDALGQDRHAQIRARKRGGRERI